MACVAAFALLVPVLRPGDPNAQSLLSALGGPDAAAPLGYDHLGRSMMLRLAHALRLSLTIAAAVAGVALGVLAAWRGVWVNRTLGLASDTVLALPGLPLALIVGAVLPNTALAFWVGLSLVLWIEFFRLTCAATRGLIASPGVRASQLLGFGPLYVFRRHLWPDIAPMLLTLSAFGGRLRRRTLPPWVWPRSAPSSRTSCPAAWRSA